MKKVSTTATKQSGNFSQQKLTIGLDLGDRSSCYCVLDESGRILRKQKESRPPPRDCKRPSPAWRAAASRWRPGCIRPR